MRIHSFIHASLLTLLLVACSTQTPVSNTVDRNPPDSETTYQNPVEPNTQVKDANHGAETGLAITALSGANGTLANGVATAYYFEDKGSIVGVQLNIASAKAGTQYAAWIENDMKKYVRIGNLENTDGDVRHSVRLDTKDDLRTYKNVIITLQQTGADSTPGEVIATGLLKDTKR